MNTMDITRQETDLSPLTSEEVEIICKRRLEKRYNELGMKLGNITSLTYEGREYNGYQKNYTAIYNYNIMDIIRKLPVVYLEALEKIE